VYFSPLLGGAADTQKHASGKVWITRSSNPPQFQTTLALARELDACIQYDSGPDLAGFWCLHFIDQITRR
jgi:hypothetical protein